MTHIVDGQFQSDKYPTCPPGKVPLSVKDKDAQDLLWLYAVRHKLRDPEFSADLMTALMATGFAPDPCTQTRKELDRSDPAAVLSELERYEQMYEGSQIRTTERREMMLKSLGVEEGGGYESLLMVLCSNHTALRKKETKADETLDLLLGQNVYPHGGKMADLIRERHPDKFPSDEDLGIPESRR